MRYFLSFAFFIFFDNLCPAAHLSGSNAAFFPETRASVFDTLQVTATVDYPSKCSRATGVVSFTVSGGSGQYAYNLGGPIVSGLPAGPGMGIVVDNVTGLADTAFFEIPVVEAEGESTITVFPPLCSGSLGNIAVVVTPGAHFATPYTFSITTSGGLAITDPGALPAGSYFLYVADADSCVLPPHAFVINSPPPLNATATLTTKNCEQGGQITLGITGGTGNYFIDWTDLNGINNSAVRTHLREGRYQVFVYDSLFCKDTLTNLLIKNQCHKRDTFHLLVPAGGSNNFCISPARGFLSSETAFQLLSGNASAYGNWSLTGNCLNYNALNTKGLNIDLICMQSITPGLMAVDTVCIQVSIVASSTAETVNFTTQVNTSTAACGTVPPVIQNRKSLPLNVTAISGFTAFGDYHLNSSTGCIAYTSFDTPQFFADSIALAVCDSITLKCHTISYVPSVLPYHDCSTGIIAEDVLSLPSVQCTTGATACLHIPYANILNYTIIDNAVPYILGASGCLDGSVTGYNIIQLPMALIQNQGPYFLDKWQVNGVSYSGGVFGNLVELVALMNQIDPSPGWYFDNQTKIIGGASTNNYGYLIVTNAASLTGIAEPVIQSASLGSTLQFSTGAHFVILKKIQTGCADTLLVNVHCDNCPPVHNYSTDISGNVLWETSLCAGDSLFLTNLPLSALDEWAVFDNGTPFAQIVPQGNNAALRLDTGLHLLHLLNTVTTCDYLFSVDIKCNISGDKMLIYTGISPNGDGKNDIWSIDGIDLFPRNEVWVYNRSGNEVFHQKGYDNQWPGTWNGKLLPDGTYYYVVDPGDGSKLLKGNLSIKR